MIGWLQDLAVWMFGESLVRDETLRLGTPGRKRKPGDEEASFFEWCRVVKGLYDTRGAAEELSWERPTRMTRRPRKAAQLRARDWFHRLRNPIGVDKEGAA